VLTVPNDAPGPPKSSPSPVVGSVNTSATSPELSSEREVIENFIGSAEDTPQASGDSAVVKQFNRLYRRKKSSAELAAEAAFQALQNWGVKQKYRTPESVNIQIADATTGAVLKEHYFATNLTGADVPSKDVPKVSAFRTQGGDYKSGVKSSVRLVVAYDGSLDVSGNAMVRVDFGDRARLVWWLNNRSDRAEEGDFRRPRRACKRSTRLLRERGCHDGDKGEVHDDKDSPERTSVCARPPLIPGERGRLRLAWRALVRRHNDVGGGTLDVVGRGARPVGRSESF
jgi:hypothetical protein